MKRTLSFLSIIALVLAFGSNVFAQNVTASADIVQDITYSTNSNLSFGQISNSQSNDAVLDPQGTADSDVGNTTTVGELEISAANGSSLVISFTNPANLSDGGSPANTIAFSPDYSGNSAGNQGSSTDLNETGNNTVTADASNGKYYVYYGGTLTGGDINGAATGNYQATITTTVNYE